MKFISKKILLTNLEKQNFLSFAVPYEERELGIQHPKILNTLNQRTL
jgi:hypothetical protein